MIAVLKDRLPLLRPMREEDLPRVLAIERTVYDFPWSMAIFRDCIGAGYVCLVYDGNDGIVGYGIMSVGAGECHLLNLSIHPDHQRRGLGTHLIHKLLEVARRRHARVAYLEVRQSNSGAYRLYTSLGFTQVGVRRNYYPARRGREHAIALAKRL